MLIYNSAIFTCSDGIIENGWLSFENGVITALGDASTQPAPAPGDLDGEGGNLTPGLIDAHCHMGLFEDGQREEETDDCNEWGDAVIPYARVIDAINPLNPTFREALMGGVTTVCVCPGSLNPIGGQCAVIKTFGKRVDDMTMKAPAAIKMAFGENPRLRGKNKLNPYTRMGAAAMIRKTMLEIKNNKKDEYDITAEHLKPLLNGEIDAHCHAHRANDIFTAVRLAREFDYNLVIVHGTEADLVIDELKGENIRVITGPSLGTRCKPELANKGFHNAVKLSEAGFKPAICTDAPVLPQESLAWMAGLAWSVGMDAYEALRAITWYPAEILGISDKVGGLRPGLRADLAFGHDDPIRTTGAKPHAVWIDGIRRA